jgi:hypothetical protein
MLPYSGKKKGLSPIFDPQQGVTTLGRGLVVTYSSDVFEKNIELTKKLASIKTSIETIKLEIIKESNIRLDRLTTGVDPNAGLAQATTGLQRLRKALDLE